MTVSPAALVHSTSLPPGMQLVSYSKTVRASLSPVVGNARKPSDAHLGMAGHAGPKGFGLTARSSPDAGQTTVSSVETTTRSASAQLSGAGLVNPVSRV